MRTAKEKRSKKKIVTPHDAQPAVRRAAWPSRLWKPRAFIVNPHDAQPAVRRAAWPSRLWKPKAFIVNSHDAQPAVRRAAWPSRLWKPKAFIVKAAGIFLCLLLIFYILLVNVLVSAALVPSFMEKLEAFERITEESYAAQVQTSDIKGNRQLALNETKEWLKTAEHQKLSVETNDGYRLIAEEFPAEETDSEKGVGGKNHKWVLLLHGYTGWKEEMYPFAYWYHKQGYHALVPDLRCQGESQGDFIGMGWTDHFDCMLWIDYILSQDEEAQIVIHGQSMGAATALMMTGEELPGQIQAVVSDCSYTDAYSMFGEKIKDWFGLPAFPLVDSACLMLRLRGGYNLKDASALEAVQKSGTPTLFIHGDSDAMISVQMSRELYEAAACEKELLIVEGAGHGQTQEKDPDTYYNTIRNFLNKTLENADRL